MIRSYHPHTMIYPHAGGLQFIQARSAKITIMQQVNSRQTLIKLIASTLLIMGSATGQAYADDSSASEETQAQSSSTDAVEKKKKTPWVFTPLLSSNPKFGTSVGGLGAYMHKFDPKSPISLFGLTANYSDTRSYNGVLFANAFFDQDRQRVKAATVLGKIENDYEDFLGTGNQVQTSDDIKLLFARYYYRIAGNWFIGVQGISTNYTSSTDSVLGDGILDLLGLGGFQSNGLGLVGYYDSRDNTRSASSGSQFLAHNMAYREGLGGDESFDTYTLEYDAYLPLWKNQVTAIQTKGRWTVNAPSSAYSTVEVPGYTRGEYLAQHMSYALVDQRISFSKRWGMSVSAGLACLYGDNVFGEDLDCFERDNLYPSISTGAIFAIKPEQKLVIRAEVSVGKSDNTAFILSFGQPF